MNNGGKYMDRVSFVAPVSDADLRVVLNQHSAIEHDTYQLSFTTAYGEARRIQWLTKDDAHRRADLLKRRGYKNVNVSKWVTE